MKQMLTAINPNDRTKKSAPLKRNKMAQITKTYAYKNICYRLEKRTSKRFFRSDCRVFMDLFVACICLLTHLIKVLIIST